MFAAAVAALLLLLPLLQQLRTEMSLDIHFLAAMETLSLSLFPVLHSSFHFFPNLSFFAGCFLPHRGDDASAEREDRRVLIFLLQFLAVLKIARASERAREMVYLREREVHLTFSRVSFLEVRERYIMLMRIWSLRERCGRTRVSR